MRVPLDDQVLAKLTVRTMISSHVRVIRRQHSPTPLGAGQADSRFVSAKAGFTSIYLAPSLETAFAETVIRDRFQSRRVRLLTEEEIKNWSAVEVRSMIQLQLTDLTGSGALQMGVSSDAVSGRNQRAGRTLGAAIHAQSPVDGILYPSRLTREPCICVFERGVHKLSAGRVVPLVQLAGLIPALEACNVAVLRS